MIPGTVTSLVMAGLMAVSTGFSFHPGHLVTTQTNSQNTYIDQAFNSQATQLRFTLNDLLKIHTILGAEDLTNLYKGEDTTRLDQLMMDNQNQLANLVQQGYGASTKDSFVTLWQNHMQEYKNYTNAKKANDTTGMNTARQNLATIATDLGNLLATPHLPAGTITNLMNDHINGTLALVDAVAANDMTQKANLMQQGYQQAGTFADTLAHGIILDKTSQF